MKTKRAKRLVKIGLPSLLLLLAALLAASLWPVRHTAGRCAGCFKRKRGFGGRCSVGGSGRRIDPVDD